MATSPSRWDSLSKKCTDLQRRVQELDELSGRLRRMSCGGETDIRALEWLSLPTITSLGGMHDDLTAAEGLRRETMCRHVEELTTQATKELEEFMNTPKGKRKHAFGHSMQSLFKLGTVANFFTDWVEKMLASMERTFARERAAQESKSVAAVEAAGSRRSPSASGRSPSASGRSPSASRRAELYEAARLAAWSHRNPSVEAQQPAAAEVAGSAHTSSASRKPSFQAARLGGWSYTGTNPSVEAQQSQGASSMTSRRSPSASRKAELREQAARAAYYYRNPSVEAQRS